MNNLLSLSSAELDAKSKQLRATIVKMMDTAKRGHLAPAFSLVEIMRVLYEDIVHFDPKNPRWELRDRCILSKGHGCLGLYVVLADQGIIPESELWKFTQSDGMLGGHPEYPRAPGVEASTGSLGHGLSIGVGFAISARIYKRSTRVFVVIGDGESNEGSIWEAALSAAKHRLSNLTVIIDYNKQQSYGYTRTVLDLEPLADKWKSFGFETHEVDGHNLEDLRSVLSKKNESDCPKAVIAHTIKGRGVSFTEYNLAWHHKNRPSKEEIESLLAELEN